MSTDFTDAPPAEPAPPARVPRGHPLIAWTVIVAAVVGLFVLRLVFRHSGEAQQIDTFEIQARALVGAATLGPKPPDIYKQAKELDRGPAGQRLRFVVLAGELKDSAEALDRLDELQNLFDDNKVPHTAEDEDTAKVLGRLYGDYKAGDLSAPDMGEEDRQELRRRLGWFGDLALNPTGGPNPAARAALLAPAQRSVVATAVVGLAAIGGSAIGFILVVVFLVLWRYLRSHFATGSPHGGVYAETFAVWMVLFVGLSLAGAYIPDSDWKELLSGLVALGSLSALAWPVFRGVPWRQVRQDIGWQAGARPALEPFFGIVCYVAAMPLVMLALLALVAATQLGQKWGGRDLFGPGGAPTHPIVDYILHSGWWGWLQALFLASVVAPFLEETMFRGVLYRHLREATGGLGRWWSVILSALVVSFVFAALHPQGLLAIPVLMSLAFGFTAAREWRGSLLPSMTVHALHNGALLLLLILMTA